MRALFLIAVAGVLTVVAALLGPAALAGEKPMGDDVSRVDLQGVNFIESCNFSHRGPDDPIVFPGKAGASHEHTFVGNRTTNASSTYGSLRAGETSCMRPADTAAYWVPALYHGSSLIAPQGATIYYRRGTLAPVTTFPNNLRMIAGDATATSPQGGRVTFWSCGAMSGIPPSSTVPTCPQGRGSFLRLHVRFPNCWDGRRLDSADHKSHMAYAMGRRCPRRTPSRFRRSRRSTGIRVSVRRCSAAPSSRLRRAASSARMRTSSTRGSLRELRRLVDDCLNALVHCGRGTRSPRG